MREIQLTGKHSYARMLVDNDIYEKMVAVGSWNGEKRRNMIFYARHITMGDKRIISSFRAHRYAGVFYGILRSLNDPLCIDHINHNGLDNRRKNLRAVTQMENIHNRLKPLGFSSSFRGVSRSVHKKGKCFVYIYWRATITIKNKFCHLGYFDNEKDAAIIWDKKARELGYPEFSLNFPVIPTERV
jgi:hypothetical protein